MNTNSDKYDYELINQNENFIFERIQKNNYKMSLCINNNNIILPKILDLNIIKLIYSLNKDIYEDVSFNQINDNEIIVITLIKNFFEDLGIAQKYTHVNIEMIQRKEIPFNQIIFNAKTISNSIKPIIIPDDAELVNVREMIITCNIITEHQVNISCNIFFQEKTNILPFIEKLIGKFVYNIFKKLIMFLEKL